MAQLSTPDSKMYYFAFAFLAAAALSELAIPYYISTCLMLAAQGPAGQAAFRATVEQFGARPYCTP
eukprot:1677948-Pyramimonas_sp.AAC.1